MMAVFNDGAQIQGGERSGGITGQHQNATKQISHCFKIK